MEHYDFLVVGGGIFGVYTAMYLAKNNQKVLLIEKERQLLTKASIVNQARLHSGYHYPRSIATALMSNENKARFTRDHEAFINFSFDKYYAIDKFGSFTDAHQFQRFCDYLNIRCKRVSDHPYINFDRLEALFLTTEYTFDPILIANHYRQAIRGVNGVEWRCSQQIVAAESAGHQWKVEIKSLTNNTLYSISAGQVINATYAASNAVNKQFGVHSIQLMHEISEMAFVMAPELKDLGLTVMDGQFGSIMPYGLSGLLSLSSVAYTHHKVSYEETPHFDCQGNNPDCQPDFLSDCNYCAVRPISNYPKMIGQMKNYFKPSINFDYFKSMFTIKSKLKANYIDDGRPTEIAILNEKPRFYCIFAGKINSIYEIEKVVEF